MNELEAAFDYDDRSHDPHMRRVTAAVSRYMGTLADQHGELLDADPAKAAEQQAKREANAVSAVTDALQRLDRGEEQQQANVFTKPEADDNTAAAVKKVTAALRGLGVDEHGQDVEPVNVNDTTKTVDADELDLGESEDDADGDDHDDDAMDAEVRRHGHKPGGPWALEYAFLRQSGMTADQARDAAEEAFDDDLGEDEE